MLRLLIDQDFDHDILRGLVRRLPTLDVVTALEVGLHRSSDSEILAWAAKNRRVVVTHDRNTMTAEAYNRIRNGEVMYGLCVVARTFPVGLMIEEIETVVACSTEGELNNLTIFLPLQKVLNL